MTQALIKALDAACKQFGGVALGNEGQQIRYDQLGTRAGNVAARLRTAGLEADDRVLLASVSVCECAC
jgi:non-ribosomal peptide synthetase component E (peptide arylation enzyme)